MRGDVKGLEKNIKKGRRMDKASARLERDLARRRKMDPVSNVDVAATRPSDFATEYLPDVSSRDVNAVRRALLATGQYYVTGVCDDRALLVAPKTRECSRYAAIRTAHGAQGTKFSNSAAYVGHNVALLNGAMGLEPLLFSSGSDVALAQDAVTVSVCRRDVNAVPLLMLTDAPDDAWPNEPADVGLTYFEFAKVQREAAKLLGLRLLTAWAV